MANTINSETPRMDLARAYQPLLQEALDAPNIFGAYTTNIWTSDPKEPETGKIRVYVNHAYKRKGFGFAEITTDGQITIINSIRGGLYAAAKSAIAKLEEEMK